jgi:hypothetical protein
MYTPPDFHSNFSLFITNDDPRTIRKAVDSKDGKFWKKAMVEEMKTLEKNESWYPMDFPTERNLIGNKWVFKKNLNVEGKVERYKACLVEKRLFPSRGN